MKKKHIILIGRICGMGGGQMYTRNKLSFVSERGWEPMVFSSAKGEILITDLKKYEGNIIEEMVVSPLVHSKKTVEKVISVLAEKIGDFDEAVIESNSVQMALWGELLAKRLNCKHMVHLLEENLDKAVPEEYLTFYWFKHSRRELSGISADSLKKLFRNSPEIDDNNSYKLSSVCSNVIYHTDEDPVHIPDDGITLGCIGRLQKKYVSVAVTAFSEIAIEHPEKIFNVMIIGDSDNEKDKKDIEDMFSGVENARLIMPGTIYPMPDATLEKVDVFVSAAGSARITYRQNIPTISIDANDLKPIGILGYTTKNTLFRENEPAEDLVNMIEKIIFEDYLVNLPYEQLPPITLETLNGHFEFMNKSQKVKEYFSVDKMKPAGKDKKKKLIRTILGASMYIKLRKKWADKIKRLIRGKGDKNAK